MRYSVFEYSQEKLVALGLDVTDALLLNWFSNFFCGKMDKKIFKDDDGNSRIFGWIKISKVQEDLPVIGIATEKGIRRRFDIFVEKGILERKTILSQNGKKSYYRTTSVYDSLINTAVSGNSTSEEENSEKSSSIPQRNSSSYAASNNPQGTKTPHADSDNPQRNSSSYAQGNSSSYAQRNSGSYALNDSLTNHSLNKDTAAVKQLSDKYFGKNAFDPGFSSKAAAFLSAHKLQEEELYFDFIKTKVAEKCSSQQSSVSSPRGLAYRLFFQNDIVQEFLDKQNQLQHEKKEEQERLQAEEKRKITCPICGEHFLPEHKEQCPSCGFDIRNFSDPKEIAVFFRLFHLPEKKRQEYQTELNNIYESNFSDFVKMSESEKSQYRIQQKIRIQKLNEEFGLSG